jgi:hypothetical protein
MAALRRGYYNAKSHPWMLGWSMIQGESEKYHTPESFYIQRYQGSWRYEIVKRMPTLPKVGTIIMYDDEKQQPIVVRYDPNVQSQYSNAPAFPKPYIRPLGNVHVAMGFNDLQILLEHVDTDDDNDDDAGRAKTNSSTLPPPPLHEDDNNNNNNNNGKTFSQPQPPQQSSAQPMKFIGYDRSTFSIAKTLVITQMLQQTTVSPHHIIEAWYSSTWNYETFMLFRYTCITLLNEDRYVNQEQSTLSYPSHAKEKIRQYLQHWAYDAVPISAVEAIQRWLYDSTEQGQVYTQTCSFHRYIDRVSLLQYFMTGEFNSSNKNLSNTEMVGSLTMWSVPDWAKSNNTDQDRVNNTVLLQRILDEIQNHPDTDLSVMEAMYNIKLCQITKLQRAVQNKEIQIDIRYGDIQPLHNANLYLIDEIRDFRATTMSWSNLVDYFEMELFHELAHYLSVQNRDGSCRTTHYGYTMNWPTTCFGTSISDYPTKKERKKILFETFEAAKKETRSRDLITLPTFEHTEDQAGDYLGRQLRPKWMDYFISNGKQLLPGNGNIVVSDDMQLNFPILRTNRSIYLTWTYQ